MSLSIGEDTADVLAVLNARGDGPLASAGQAAFARLYDRHAPVVRALCRAHSVSETQADDALQETFVRAFRLLEQTRGSPSIRSWLYAIARLVCSEQRRAGARRAHHEQAARDEATHEMSHAESPTPMESVARREMLVRLGAAVERLDEDERTAIHLYYAENDPVLAANSAMGLSRSGYYKLLARARERLAVMLKEQSAEGTS